MSLSSAASAATENRGRAWRGRRRWPGPAAAPRTAGHLVYRVGLGGGALGAQPVSEHLARFGVAEQAEGEQAGAVGGGQSSQLAAAGDQDQAAGAGRATAGGPAVVAGVVQYDHHLLARQQAADRPARASGPGGIRSAVTPSASRNPRSASAGSAGAPAGSKPRRFTYSCPSGNRRRPGAPSAPPGRSSRPRRSRRSPRSPPSPELAADLIQVPGQRRQFASPADERALGRQLARDHAIGMPGGLCRRRVGHEAGGRSAPRIGGTRSPRAQSGGPGAAVTHRTVRGSGSRVRPRFRSLMARTLTPDLLASSSIVIRAASPARRSHRPSTCGPGPRLIAPSPARRRPVNAAAPPAPSLRADHVRHPRSGAIGVTPASCAVIREYARPHTTIPDHTAELLRMRLGMRSAGGPHGLSLLHQ